jgi:hypothetical protein
MREFGGFGQRKLLQITLQAGILIKFPILWVDFRDVQ